MKNRSKFQRNVADQKLLDETREIDGTITFVLGGKTMRPGDFAPLLEKRIAAADDVAKAEAAWHAAVARERAVVEATHAPLARYREMLVLVFGTDLEKLAKLGVAPRRQPRKLTADEKVRKAERALATRAARGTMGPRQREKIRAALTEPAPPEPPEEPR